MSIDPDPAIALGRERARLYAIVEESDEAISWAHLDALYRAEDQLLTVVPASLEACWLYARMVSDRCDEVPEGLENLIRGLEQMLDDPEEAA
jgi:hypothetical protein